MQNDDDQLTLYSVKGLETDECQGRSEAVGKENKSSECRQGIEDRCQRQKKNRWKSLFVRFVGGVEASEMHADVEKHGQMLMT